MEKKRAIAVFNISKLRRLGDFRNKAATISANIAGNTTLFATPSPTVVVVNGHISDLDAAQIQVGQRVPGSVAVRNEAYNTVLNDIRAWVMYVQALADASADFDSGVILVTTAGFDLRVNGRFIKPQLRIKTTDNPAVVKLIAVSAGPRAAYEWQQSINNGASWVNQPTTTKANTEMSGLTAKTSYLFRFRPVVKSVTNGWSMPVSMVGQ